MRRRRTVSSTRCITKDGRTRKSLSLAHRPVCPFSAHFLSYYLPLLSVFHLPCHCDSSASTTSSQLQCALLTTSAFFKPHLLKHHSWDDWVEEDRLRKLTPENRELANSLRHAVLEQQRAQRAQAQPMKKKAQTSTRGSEERQTPAQTVQPRGQKRMRDHDLEKVSKQIGMLKSVIASCLVSDNG